MTKNVKGGPLGVFEYPFFCKIEKIEGGLLETLKELAKKLTKRKNIWPWTGLEPTSFCLADLKKFSKNRRRRSFISVAVSRSQPLKLIKSVTSLVLKKVSAIICVFYEKRRLNIESASRASYSNLLTE